MSRTITDTAVDALFAAQSRIADLERLLDQGAHKIAALESELRLRQTKIASLGRHVSGLQTAEECRQLTVSEIRELVLDEIRDHGEGMDGEEVAVPDCCDGDDIPTRVEAGGKRPKWWATLVSVEESKGKMWATYKVFFRS